jgi:hypothetical protein
MEIQMDLQSISSSICVIFKPKTVWSAMLNIKARVAWNINYRNFYGQRLIVEENMHLHIVFIDKMRIF